MKISSLSEFDLIEKIRARFSRGLPKQIIGIGDDCAVIDQENGICRLYTTDLLVEGIHFLRQDISARDLGYKALAVNLSDIAAMGGTPRYALLSLALPRDLEVEWVEEFLAGFQQCAEEFGVSLIGGDTTRSLEHVFIGVEAHGDCERERVKSRAAAKPGDVICVTSCLGDSGAGLTIILEQLPRAGADEQEVLQAHYRPRSLIAEGRFLSARPSVHAMMDLSDGIASDLPHILDRSRCGAEIELERLPISGALSRLSAKHGWDAQEMALVGGEDYALLFTIAKADFKSASKEFESTFQKPLFAIGQVTAEAGRLVQRKNGVEVSLHESGFKHFG